MNHLYALQVCASDEAGIETGVALVAAPSLEEAKRLFKELNPHLEIESDTLIGGVKVHREAGVITTLSDYVECNP